MRIVTQLDRLLGELSTLYGVVMKPASPARVLMARPIRTRTSASESSCLRNGTITEQDTPMPASTAQVLREGDPCSMPLTESRIPLCAGLDAELDAVEAKRTCAPELPVNTITRVAHPKVTSRS